MKTIDVKNLFTEALASLPKPYSEDVIDEVFFAIELNANWHNRYLACSRDLGKDVVNNSGCKWVSQALGKTGEREIPSKLSRLIGSYTVLDTDAPPVVKKPAAKRSVVKKPPAPEASKVMSDYYMANKNSLPPNIGLYRNEIIALIKAGVPVAEAFEKAVDAD